jgi:hypothetical protein
MTNLRPEFEFLNRLRESGETNMFGASPYLACAFSLPKREASKILQEWISWVNEEPSRVNL